LIAPLLILRPQPGNAASCAAAELLGVEPVAPSSRSNPWHGSPHPTEIDALLIGSANALRHAGPHLAAYAGKPAYTVGETTAQAARQAGLHVEAVGSGGLQTVLDQVAPNHSRLLRLAGYERVVLTLPPHATMIERTVYAAAAARCPRHRAADAHPCPARRGGRAAFGAGRAPPCPRDRQAGPAARTAAPRHHRATGHGGGRDGWGALHTAPRPDDRSLLALAAQLCHTPALRVGD
jgi:uroporphyrinogen-III synthase